MTISEQITRIKNAKAAIKQAIQNKGVTVSDTAKLDEYPALIDSITAGSGESYERPDFYELRTKGGTDYRGLFCYAYTKPGEDVIISDFDSSRVTDMSYMFSYAGNSAGEIIGLHSLDFSSVRNMAFMFYMCSAGGNINLSGISFPEAKDTNRMFANNYYIKAIDVSNVDMPKVTDAGYMFAVGSSSLVTSINLTGINMPSITTAENMFNYCAKVTSLDVSGINFSKVTNINALFYNCKLLVDITGEIDLSSVSSGLYSSASYNPFRYCYALETLYLKNIYKDVTTMKNEAKWSLNLSETKVKDECLIYIINELPDLINDKGLTATDKIVLTLPPTNTLTQEQKQVARDKGWQVVN